MDKTAPFPPVTLPQRLWAEVADAAVLRRWWTNFAPVAPGVYRSNHPNHARLDRYKAMGIDTVLSLRGGPDQVPQRMEVESCATLGLRLEHVSLAARRPSPRRQYMALFDMFDRLPRPFVMHCKSGADRAGIALGPVSAGPVRG